MYLVLRYLSILLLIIQLFCSSNTNNDTSNKNQNSNNEIKTTNEVKNISNLNSAENNSKENNSKENNPVENNDNIDFKNAISKINFYQNNNIKQFLKNSKHDVNIALTYELATFLAKLTPFRFDIKYGIQYYDNKISFWWFISEFGIKGNNVDGINKITEILEKLGFKHQKIMQNQYGYNEYHYDKNDEFLTHHLFIEGLENFDGTKEEKCGGSLSYNIQVNIPTSEDKLSEILTFYPKIKCKSLPNELFELFKNKKISYIGYGGTWYRYYTWNIKISLANNPNLLSDIQKILSSLKYKLYQENKNHFTYKSSGNHTSFIYLSLKEKGFLSFRFQPNS